MLENEVTKISELRSVKAQADQHRTQTGKALTYQQYCQLVLSAAQQYDGQFEPAQSKSRPRQVYQHEYQDYDSTLEAYSHVQYAH
jgi:hypothetical protein